MPPLLPAFFSPLPRTRRNNAAWLANAVSPHLAVITAALTEPDHLSTIAHNAYAVLMACVGYATIQPPKPLMDRFDLQLERKTFAASSDPSCPRDADDFAQVAELFIAWSAAQAKRRTLASMKPILRAAIQQRTLQYLERDPDLNLPLLDDLLRRLRQQAASRAPGDCMETVAAIAAEVFNSQNVADEYRTHPSANLQLNLDAFAMSEIDLAFIPMVQIGDNLIIAYERASLARLLRRRQRLGTAPSADPALRQRLDNRIAALETIIARRDATDFVPAGGEQHRQSP